MQYTPASITTSLMLGVTAWLIVGRFRLGCDSNWPLFYYLLLVAFHQAFAGVLNPTVVFAVVLSGLFLRFEYMGGPFLKFVRLAECFLLAMIGWRLVGVLTG